MSDKSDKEESSRSGPEPSVKSTVEAAINLAKQIRRLPNDWKIDQNECRPASERLPADRSRKSAPPTLNRRIA